MFYGISNTIIDNNEDQSFTYLIMEIMDTNLHQFIESFKNRNKEISNEISLSIACQITKSMNILHKLNIVHRDLKVIYYKTC